MSRRPRRQSGVSPPWRGDRAFHHRDTKGTETEKKEMGFRILDPDPFHSPLRTPCLCGEICLLEAGRLDLFGALLDGVGDRGFAAQLFDQGGAAHAKQVGGFLLVAAGLVQGKTDVGVFGLAQQARQIHWQP